jgi:phage shock protein A
LIAEEVDKVYPELVIRDGSGKIQGVRYEELAPMLLNEVKKQQQTIEAQSVHAAAQDQEIAYLKKMVLETQAGLAKLQSGNELVAQR